MPSEIHAISGDVAYQRAYAAVAAQALQHTGYVSATALQGLKLFAGPDVIDRILLHLHNAELLYITYFSDSEPVYDFLPLLEKMASEADSEAESDVSVRLARLYCGQAPSRNYGAVICLQSSTKKSSIRQTLPNDMRSSVNSGGAGRGWCIRPLT